MWIDNKELSETEVKSKIHKLEKENSELKEMLKNAMININSLCFCGSENCDYCIYDNNIEGCNNSDGFYWVYKEQVLKLIGGDANGADE